MSTLKINHSRNHRFTYDVAFSFAEEDRHFVDTVAELLKAANVIVYNYNHKHVADWGKDLTVHLDKVYRTEARFCVMFISAHYKEKRWSQQERVWATARSFFMEEKEYILPFRLDNTVIPGLKDTMAYLPRETYNEGQLAQAIIEKVAQSKTDQFPILQKMRHFFSNKIKLAAVSLLTLGISGFGLADQLTPVAILAQRIYERDVTHFRAVCKDGSLSRTRSRGSCSHHGGIADKVDTMIYNKTMGQCEQEAAQISWIKP